MSQITVDRAVVVESISQAFAGVKREDGISLHEAKSIDAWAMEADQARARAKDTELRWEDVPAEDIAHGYNVLPYLDAKGFRYYIPAFMLWTLQNLGQSSSLTIESTIFALAPYATQPWEKYTLVSKPQAAAIAQFLGYVVEEADGRADAEIALDAFSYWTERNDADS